MITKKILSLTLTIALVLLPMPTGGSAQDVAPPAPLYVSLSHYQIENSGMQLDLPLDTLEPLAITHASSGHTLRWEFERAKGVEVNYLPLEYGVEAFLLLHSGVPALSYTFSTADLEAEIDSDNDLVFTQVSEEPARRIPIDDGGFVSMKTARQYISLHPRRFKISAPFMEDAEGRRLETRKGAIYDRGGESNEGYLQVKLDGERLILIPDQDWLKNAAFPVRVRQTIEPMPVIVEEIKSRRTWNSRHFRTDQEGQFKGMFHVGALNYYDRETRTYEVMDTTLVPRNDAGWRMNKASYHLDIAGNSAGWFEFINTLYMDPMTKEIVDAPFESIKMRALGVHDVKGEVVTGGDWAGKRICFKDAYEEGVDLELTAKNQSFAKEVVFHKEPREVEYSFEMGFSDDFTIEAEGKIWDGKAPIVTSEQVRLGKERNTYFRKFILRDAERHTGSIKVRIQKTGARSVKLTKILDKEFFKTAVYPVRTDTVTSYYAGAGDGECWNSSTTSWDAAHDAASGNSTNYTGDTYMWGGENVSGTWKVWRVFYPVDTSALPDATDINDSILRLYSLNGSLVQDNDGNDFAMVVQTTQASTSSLAHADFDQCGSINNPTEGSERKDLNNVSSGYTGYIFTLTGRGWVSKTGWTKLGIREGHDCIDESIASGDNYVQTRGSEYTGTDQDPYVSVVYGEKWYRSGSGTFTIRTQHLALVYSNKLWTIGGFTTYGGTTRLNDVWYTTDEVSWTQATSAANWSGREGLEGCVYNNKMWITGGWRGAPGSANDVWYSTDGITWTQATSAANWTARYQHSVLSYNNKMWVIGGSGYKNDVWYSTDGITWTQASAAANWTARYNHTSVVFDNKMWVIGGWDTAAYKNDVWYSTDGITWTQASAAANWSKRYYHSSAVFDNKIWVIGGHDGARKNDVWYSSDGITWTQETQSSWSARFGQASEVYNYKLFITAGDDGSYKNDSYGRKSDIYAP